MASNTLPPSLKSLTPYIKRAEDLDRDTTNPDSMLVAYYCRMFAINKGIDLKGTSNDVMPYLQSLMGLLETNKSTMNNIPKDQAKCTIENYACSLFSGADDTDMNAVANKETAMEFYKASTFFEILEQFGPVDQEVTDKNLYAKWKATDINRALKEGRQPSRGGPDGEGISNNASSSPNMAPLSLNNIPEVPTNQQYTETPNHQQYAPSLPQNYGAPTNYSQQPQYVSPPPPSYNSAPIARQPSADQSAKDAIELCNFAITALKVIIKLLLFI
jgi:vacuolar protein sorting-associated protein VTA1